MKTTDQEFGQVLANLLVTTGFARKNYSPDWMRFTATIPGVSYESLRKAVTGERDVSEDLMRRVAQALKVEPTVFIEYRLSQARRELDPKQVGWTRAAEALRQLEMSSGRDAVA